MHRNSVEAITKQLDAMGCEAYQIGIMDDKGFYDTKKEKHTPRMDMRPRPLPKQKPGEPAPVDDRVGLTSEAILTKHLNWLARENAVGGVEKTGCHIFIRPFGPTDLTFIDDLKKPTVDRMTQDGYEFAVLIESSPNNFHGWLKNARTLSPEEETVAAQTICAMYSGDKGAASKMRFGRLAGYTNRKEKYRDPELSGGAAGGFPYVKIHVASGKVFTNAEKFLDLIEQTMEKNQVASVKQVQESQKYQQAFQGRPGWIKDISHFQAQFSQKGERYRADYRYAIHALSNGVSGIEVEHVIRTQSQSGSMSPKYAQGIVDKVLRKRGQAVNTHQLQQNQMSR